MNGRIDGRGLDRDGGGASPADSRESSVGRSRRRRSIVDLRGEVL